MCAKFVLELEFIFTESSVTFFSVALFSRAQNRLIKEK